MGKLDGKVALITGAASGIGRASAILFAKEGAKVAAVDFAVAGGQETVKMIKDVGGKAVLVEADVSQAADVARMVKTTVEAYGRLDILFNNAGMRGPMCSTAKTLEARWDFVINVNLKSVFLGSKYAIPVMLSHGGGVIVNTASTVGIDAVPYLPAYSAAKGGVIQLTKSMALELGKKNIRVNCVCPGATQTAMLGGSGVPEEQAVPLGHALGRVAQPEEIANAALYLASDDSSYVTGTILVVDGGWICGSILFARD